MSKVPAWKKVGLQVKSEVENDPLSTTTHLDGSVIDNKLAKTLNKKRRAQEDQKDQKDDKTKKPPKRVKLPKSERPPPPEKDQLTYLKQFSQDKENWKFSKQKQNWLLKNIETIPAEYESFLIEYIEGIQGGARDRIVEDLKAVIVSWNEYSKKLEEKINAELYGQKDEPETEGDKKESEGDKTEPDASKGPSKEYAIRCKKILMALVDEEIEMEGENVEEPPQENKVVEPETSEAKSEGSEQAEDGEPDNLVIDEVEVEEYDKDIEFEKPKKEEKKEKKEKKVKKEKKEKKEKAKKEHN